MDIRVNFPGGKRVDARFGRHVVHTDQPPTLGGADAAPAPFELFLSSLATCAGIYVLGFCQARGISTDGIELVQHTDYDDTGRLSRVQLEIHVPPMFPEKYRAALVRVAESCKVKKVIADPPEIVAVTRVTGEGELELAVPP